MRIYKFILFVSLASIFWYSCKESGIPNNEDFIVSARITRDPSFLFPSKSTATVETQINQYLFLTLANYDPYKLELIPILLKEIPTAVRIEEGAFSGTLRFDCQIKGDAVWDNGAPVTGYDYLFSVKLFKIEGLKMNPSIKSLFKEMIDVEIDPSDPQKFSIYVDQAFHLSKELALIAELMPEYIYDPDQIFRKYDLDKGAVISPIFSSGDSLILQKTIDFLNHADCGRKVIVGSGPYQFEDWQTNQFVSLVKKKNYWGENYPDNPYLSANPDKLVFAVYPDENAAITALRNGALDVISTVNGYDYKKMQEDDRVNERFTFFNPPQLKYYFIGLNNHSELLKDVRVRKALAHLIDINAFIENHEQGYGARVPGPIVPARRYFNDTLKLIEFDPESAKSILAEAGWTDTNNNGILDKIIEGKRRELTLKTYITGKILSRNLALILKEESAKAGVEIEIITKEAQLIKQEITNRNFDLFPTGTVYGPYPEDLYQSWHSSNDYMGGSNKYGYNNAEADETMEKIRNSGDQKQIEHLYRRIQEIIYKDQAFIFLYAPTNNIIINNKFKASVTYTKGGYLLNLFEKSN
jgi:ABC-type transport system substrate-binding protein